MLDAVLVHGNEKEKRMRDEIALAFGVSKSEVVRFAIRELHKSFAAGKIKRRSCVFELASSESSDVER